MYLATQIHAIKASLPLRERGLKLPVYQIPTDTYYAHYVTSRRVPNKKYPVQIIKGLTGKIDEHGFHPLTRNMVDVEHVIIREFDFTNYLLYFEEEYVSRERKGATVKDLRNLYQSMIVYQSNNLYLCDDPPAVIYFADKMVRKCHVGIPN